MRIMEVRHRHPRPRPPPETPAPRGTRVYSGAIRRVIQKLITEKRDEILSSRSSMNKKALDAGWRRNNDIVNAIGKILKDAGIDPTSRDGADENRTVDQIFSIINRIKEETLSLNSTDFIFP